MATTDLTPGRKVNAGESTKITGTLYDFSGVALNKAAIDTVTLTAKDMDGTIINLRDAQSILDANGGSLASDGTLTIKLSPTDNAMQCSTADSEWHFLRITWTWTDGDGDSQTGIHDATLQVVAMDV